MNHRIWPVAALMGVLAAVAPGCNNSSGDHLTPVKGKITYKGTPLASGTIVFIPDTSRGTRGNLAIADIQGDGTFTLKSNDALGVVPGFYKVTVSCVQTLGPGQLPQSVLPPRYSDPQHAGLACQVMANKTNTIDFELE